MGGSGCVLGMALPVGSSMSTAFVPRWPALMEGEVVGVGSLSLPPVVYQANTFFNNRT